MTAEGALTNAAPSAAPASDTPVTASLYVGQCVDSTRRRHQHNNSKTASTLIDVCIRDAAAHGLTPQYGALVHTAAVQQLDRADRERKHFIRCCRARDVFECIGAAMDAHNQLSHRRIPRANVAPPIVYTCVYFSNRR